MLKPAPLPPIVEDFVLTWGGEVMVRRRQDLGFGGHDVTLLRMSATGEQRERTGYKARLLVLRDHIAGVWVRAGYVPKSPVWAGLRRAVLHARRSDIGHPHKAGYVTHEQVDRAQVARFRSMVASQLGASIPVIVPAHLRAAYELLMALPSQIIFGTFFGYGSSPPPGRREIKALTRARRLDLLHNVLRGINPEGRVYAAEALLMMSKRGVMLSVADLFAIKKVRALPIPVKSCAGCSVVFTKTAAELLKSLP